MSRTTVKPAAGGTVAVTAYAGGIVLTLHAAGGASYCMAVEMRPDETMLLSSELRRMAVHAERERRAMEATPTVPAALDCMFGGGRSS